MIYPKKELAQLVIHACKEYNIEHIVISPGSRNAPLNIGFYNDEHFEVFSIVDERCAAFFALGIAQQTKKPVALVCTSGSALLNYYPAIAEAYYSDIPLVVLSADRPKHLLEIGDGQTIKQENVFVNHIIRSVNLIESSSKNKENYQAILEALQMATDQKGPVHINIPFDEPLYETVELPLDFSAVKTIQHSAQEEKPLDVDELQTFADSWNASKKKLVLIGAQYPSELIQTQIAHLLKDESVLVFTETTSNVHHPKIVNGIDKLIFSLDETELAELQPEILLTFGGMIVSKKIKRFLRDHQPKHHWHVDAKKALDTYHCLTKHFKVSTELFFSQFFFLTKNMASDYQTKWLTVNAQKQVKHKDFIAQAPFSDLKVFNTILPTIPENSVVQFANSSIIRYAQLFNLSTTLKTFCNRGTSGIDGSTSTAVGCAYIRSEPTVFITGDISFFYDSNALWNNYIPANFRIILINNSGGGIFRFIPGPKSTNALPLFETPHDLNASQLADMFNFDYENVKSIEQLKKAFPNFYKTSKRPKILEIFTPGEVNDLVLKDYFATLVR